MNPKYPDIEVRLTGQDGNAMVIIGAVARALKANGHADEVSQFMDEAMSGDYDNLLTTCVKWVSVS